MDAAEWIGVVAIIVTVLVFLLGILCAIIGWLTNQNLRSINDKVSELPAIRRELGQVTTNLAVVEERTEHHAAKQEEFCDRLGTVEKTVLRLATSK